MASRDSEKNPRHDLAWLLDECIRLPGGYRIGIDGLIGLIPGVGDVVGGILASLLLFKAVRRGVPKAVLMTMILNILVDTAFGSVPVLGDLFDFYWKANSRNSKLLALYDRDPDAAERLCAQSNLAPITAILLAIGLIVYAIYYTLTMFWAFIHGAG